MTDKHTATIEDVRIKAMETQGKHLDFLALAFQQALKCDLRQIELVQQNEGNKIIWYYRKKETHDALVEALENHVDIIEEVLSLKDNPRKMELFEEIAVRLLKVVTESKAALKAAKEGK